MKKIVYILLIPFSISLNSFGQKLIENKVDEFTKKSVKRTTWSKLVWTPSIYMHSQVSKINEDYSFSIKLMHNKTAFSINEGDEIMFILENDSVMKFPSVKYAITCRGCGSVDFIGASDPGIETHYLLNKSQLEYLSDNKIKKMRIYTSKGYIESEVKSKPAATFSKQIELVSK